MKKPRYVNREIACVQKIRTHRFRGKTYRIEVRHLDDTEHGHCEEPGAKGKSIRIDPDQDGRRLMQTLVDESLHACNFDLCNVAVDEMAESISKLLWRCGYRLVPSGRDKKR